MQNTDDLAGRLELIVALRAFDFADYRDVPALANDMLNAGYVSDALVELFYARPGCWADIDFGLDALKRRTNFDPDRREAYLIITHAYARWAQAQGAAALLLRWSGHFILEENRSSWDGFDLLAQAYFDLDEPPEFFVARRHRERFARVAFGRWILTHGHAYREIRHPLLWPLT